MAASPNAFYTLLFLLALPYVFVIIGLFTNRMRPASSDIGGVTLASNRQFLLFFVLGLVGLGVSLYASSDKIRWSDLFAKAFSIEAPTKVEPTR